MAQCDDEICSCRLMEQGFFPPAFFARRILDEHLLSIGKTQKQMQAQIENRSCTHDFSIHFANRLLCQESWR
jgi:hypothetical protein